MDALNVIRETKVISILRGVGAEQLHGVMDALYDGGVRCVEIALNSDGALKMIDKAKKDYGGRMLIGAGTVLDGAGARLAIEAGADFALSPTLSFEFIKMCLTYNVLAVPGVFMLIEVLSAWQAGARLIKVFPAGSVGPSYIKGMKGPLPQLELLPVGGVTAENAADYIRAGAAAVGIGSCLVNSRNAGDADTIRAKAEKLTSLLKNVPKSRT